MPRAELLILLLFCDDDVLQTQHMSEAKKPLRFWGPLPLAAPA